MTWWVRHGMCVPVFNYGLTRLLLIWTLLGQRKERMKSIAQKCTRRTKLLSPIPIPLLDSILPLLCHPLYFLATGRIVISLDLMGLWSIYLHVLWYVAIWMYCMHKIQLLLPSALSMSAKRAVRHVDLFLSMLCMGYIQVGHIMNCMNTRKIHNSCASCGAHSDPLQWSLHNIPWWGQTYTFWSWVVAVKSPSGISVNWLSSM